MIPNDQHIIDRFPPAPGQLHIRDLLRSLDLPRSERPALRERLRALAAEGKLERVRGSRYARPLASEGVVGQVSMSDRGFGFLMLDDDRDDIFVAERDLAGALHRDRVRAEVRRGDRGKPQAKIIEVLERGTYTFVATYRTFKGGHTLHPDDPRLPDHVGVTDAGQAEDGQSVACEFVEFPDGRANGSARVIKVLGGEGGVADAVEATLYDLGLPLRFPEKVEAEAAACPAELDEAERARRVDLRERALLTIDPESARDFDDALHAEQLPDGGWRLTVAIADVSHFVRPGTALDDEARLRATSVYFPDRVVPMLPHRLSNDLCSLRPDEERPAMVAELEVLPDGEIDDAQFYEAVIRSHARFTYDRAARMLGIRHRDDTPQTDDDDAYEALRPVLQALLDVTRCLRARRRRRGYLELQTTEPRVYLDAEGDVEDVRPAVRHEAHQLVEDAMLAANEAVAHHFVDEDLPAIFRVHDRPDREGVERFLAQAKALGAPMRAGGITPAALSTYLRQQKSHPHVELINLLVLRSMAKAVYEGEVSPHFGLGAPRYLHFTSPIRRYPDLAVHRQLKAEIAGETTVDPEALEALAAHCSRRERLAVTAERTMLDTYKCIFLARHVGEEFDGTVVGVVGMGLFVQIDEHSVEGLVHVERLDDDYYNLDEETGDLVGRRTRARYRLGDRLRVEVRGVDIARRRVDFDLVRRLKPGD